MWSAVSYKESEEESEEEEDEKEGTRTVRKLHKLLQQRDGQDVRTRRGQKAALPEIGPGNYSSQSPVTTPK